MGNPQPKSLFDVATELEEKHCLLHNLLCAFYSVHGNDDYQDIADGLLEATWRASRSLKVNVADAYAVAFTEKRSAA